MKPEIFKTINDYPLYEISNYGNVRSWCNNKWGKSNHPKRLIKSIGVNGRASISMVNGVKDARRYIHHLVLEAFVGLCPKGMEGCHNDGNPINNHIDNLRWDTPKNNSADKKKHGTLLIGSKVNGSKLVENDIIKIFKMRQEKLSLEEIAQTFKVSYSVIGEVLRRERWSHVQIPKNVIDSIAGMNLLKKLNKRDIIDIFQMNQKGYCQEEIAKRFHTKKNNISRILNRKRWGWVEIPQGLIPHK